jgi:hypothetical protein
MAREVPLEVFQAGLVVSILYYGVCIALYILRRDTFPIKQQSPWFSLLGLACAAAIGTVVVVSDAYPHSTSFSSCTAVMEALIPFVYGVQIVIVTCLFWIGRRYFASNVSLRNQKEIFGFQVLGQRDAIVESWGGKALMIIEDLFLHSLTRVNPSTFNLTICAVFVIFGIVDLSLLIHYAAQLPDNVLVHTIDCYPLIFVTSLVKFLSFLVSSSVVLLLFLALVKLNDNLGVGAAFRILLGIMSAVMISIAALIYEPVAIEFMINTKLYGFFLGLILMPASFTVRGYYYIWLSYQNEKKSQKKKKNRIAVHSAANSVDSEGNGLSSFQDGERAFQEVLMDLGGKMLLQNFMQNEFSVENLMFIEACSTYEACFQPPGNGASAAKLGVSRVDNFIRDSGAFSVNIAYNMRMDILNQVGAQKAPRKSNAVEVGPKLSVNQRNSQIAISLEGKESLFHPELFDEAKKEIKHLILKDTFTRFKISEEYRKWSGQKS